MIGYGFIVGSYRAPVSPWMRKTPFWSDSERERKDREAVFSRGNNRQHHDLLSSKLYNMTNRCSPKEANCFLFFNAASRCSPSAVTRHLANASGVSILLKQFLCNVQVEKCRYQTNVWVRFIYSHRGALVLNI